MGTVTLLIIAALLTLVLIFYRRDRLNGLNEQIKDLQTIKNELENEIETKKEILKTLNKQIDPTNELNFKLDFLINNRNQSNTAIITLLIIISTGIILFFLYKFTYWIQPDHISNAINDGLSKYNLQDIFK